MNSHFYTTTIMKATSASFSETGYFISPTQFNLIVAKCNCIEIYLINEHGLVLLSEIELYGKIEIMKVFRPKIKNTDLIFVVTAEYNAMILEFIQESDKIQIITKGYCNVFDNDGIPIGFMAIIEPNAKIVLLKLFDCLFKVISLDTEGELKVFSFAFEETDVQDLCFLYGCTDPTFIIIHENTKGQCISVKEINTNSIESKMSIQNHFFTGKKTSMVIPIPKPIGGVIIVGVKSIVYYNGWYDIGCSLIHQKIHIVCYTRLDLEGTRYLLGDQSGLLFMLFVKYEKISEQKCTVQKMELHSFGETSIPSALSHLDNKVIFIASKYGNSQLIELNYDLNGLDTSISILDENLNIGPIMDMCSVNIDQCEEQIVTCSGAYKDGSLRIISKEVEIQQRATIDLLGIKRIWALNYDPKSDLDNTLVLSYFWHSKILTYTNKEFEDIHFEGFESELQTFYCGKILDNKMVQITSASVRLICMESKKLINEWNVPDFKNIIAASCNDQRAVCSSGNDLYYIEIGSETIFQIMHITLKHEVSCLDICLFKDVFDETIILLAVGLWIDTSIKIFKLPDFVELIKEPLLEGIVPRSISFVTLENMQYLFCALENGNLYYFVVNVETLETGILCKKKMIKLGNQPALIKKFQTTSNSNIFICSEKPIIIYSSNKKLVFTRVNSIKINNLCVMNMVDDPNSLIMATDTSIIIGTVDIEKKYHVRSIYLHESPRRIAYQEISKTFAITTVKNYRKRDIRDGYFQPSASTCIPNTSGVHCLTEEQPIKDLLMIRSKKTNFNYNPEFEISNMIILHQDTFEILHVYRLQLNEYALSIISTKLGNDPKTYYVLGTAFMGENCQTPEKGRIIVFHYDSSTSKLTHIAERPVLGGCFSMIQHHNQLIASINCSLQSFIWHNDRDQKHFVLHENRVHRSISQHLRSNGKCIMHDDLMKTITHYKYKTDELNKIVTDYLKWPSAIEIIDDNLFMGAVNDNNLYVFEKSRVLGTNYRRFTNFQLVGRFHMCDLINIFNQNLFITKQFENADETKVPIQESIMYGTVSGALGFIIKTNSKFSGFLADFQKSLTTVVKKMEMMPHHFETEFTKFNTGFLDGNLMKKFLKLSISNKESVIEGLRDSYNCEFQRIFKQSEIDIEAVTNFIKDLTQ